MPGVAVVNQPGVYLVDADGNVVTADNNTTIADHEGILVAGSDGSVLRFMRVASDGTLRVDPTGTTTQPISASSLPLPADAASETKLEAVRVLLASLDGKDYATETKLEAVRVLLASLDTKDYATQTTLAGILVDTGQIETLLTAIDADTSNLNVALSTRLAESTFTSRINTQGQKTMAASTPVVLASNQSSVPVTDNGGSLTVDTPQLPASLVGGRLTTNLGAWLGSTAPTVGQKAMASSVPVTLASDQTSISVTSGVSVGTGSISELLLNGGSSDLVVNGSTTPVVFSYSPPAAPAEIQLTSLRFVMSVGGSFDFDGNSFAEGSALSNGVSVDIVANNGAFSQQLTEFNINEDFARLLDFKPFSDIDAVLTASLPFGGNVVLVGGSSDTITVTINDNMGGGGRGIDYFTATVYGVQL